MSYVQQQHTFKYAAFGGSPDSGAAAGSPLHPPPSSGLLLDPMPQSNGSSPMPALGGGVGLSPSARLDDAIAQLRNLGGSSSSSSTTYSQRSASLRTAAPVGGVRLVGIGSYSTATAAAASSGGDGDLSSNDGSSASGGNSLPRHRPAVPYTLVAGMPPSKPRDAGVSWSDGEGGLPHDGSLPRQVPTGPATFSRTTVTAVGNAQQQRSLQPGSADRLQPTGTTSVTYDTQGRCSCCPYGFHVDVDFLNMPEASNSSTGVVAQLKRIREDRRAQRKSMEVQLFLQQQQQEQQLQQQQQEEQQHLLQQQEQQQQQVLLQQQQQMLLQQMLLQQQQQQQQPDRGAITTRSSTTVAFSPSMLVSGAAPTFSDTSGYTTIDQNEASASLFLDDVDSTVRSIGRPADRSQKRSKSSSASSEDLLPASLTTSQANVSSLQQLTRSDSSETLDSLHSTSDGIGHGAVHPVAPSISTVVTSRRFAETMAMHLPDTATTEAVTISPESFRQIKEHVSLSLQRMRELEEQVRAIPVMQERISVLKEEKRLLAVQLKAKDVRTNMRSIGVGDSPVHEPEVASRPVVPTAEAGVGAGDVNDELLPSTEITRLVRETVEITRQREIHTWIQAAQLQLNESRLASMRSVGVGDSIVGSDDELKIREKELRTIVIGQMEDKEQRNVGVQVKAATRDASVLYQYQEEKAPTRSVGVNVDIADLIQNSQEQAAAAALGSAAPAAVADAAAAAAGASLSGAEQGGAGLLFSSSSSSSQSWTLQSYAIQRRFLEASKSGRREDLIAFVQGLLRRSVRSFGVVAKPSTSDATTACDGGGPGGRCDAAVGEDRTDVVVRPAFVVRDATTSAKPETSSACTWTDSVATRDAASMASVTTVDRSTGALDTTLFRRDVGMVTVPASVRSMETNTPPLDVSAWLAREETSTSRGSASVSLQRRSPAEKMSSSRATEVHAVQQSQHLSSSASGSRPASTSPSGEAEQTLYEEWTEVRTVPFEYVGSQVGGAGIQPLPSDLVNMVRLSETGGSAVISLPTTQVLRHVADAAVDSSGNRATAVSSGSSSVSQQQQQQRSGSGFSSSQSAASSGSALGVSGSRSASSSSSSTVVTTTMMSTPGRAAVTIDADPGRWLDAANALLLGSSSRQSGADGAAETTEHSDGSELAEQQRQAATVRLSSQSTGRALAETARRDAADPAAAAAALSSMADLEAREGTARIARDLAAAERQRMLSAAELLTGAGAVAATAETAAAVEVASGGGSGSSRSERFSSRLDRVISSPPVQVGVRVRLVESSGRHGLAESDVSFDGVDAASGKLRTLDSTDANVAAIGATDWDGAPRATTSAAAATASSSSSKTSSSTSAVSRLGGGLTTETVEEAVSVQGGLTSTSRTVTRTFRMTSSSGSGGSAVVTAHDGLLGSSQGGISSFGRSSRSRADGTQLSVSSEQSGAELLVLPTVAAAADGSSATVALDRGASAGSTASASVVVAKKTISFEESAESARARVSGPLPPPPAESSSGDDSSSSSRDSEESTSFDEGSYDGRRGEVSFVCKDDASNAEGVQAAVSRLSSSSVAPAAARKSPPTRADGSSSGGGAASPSPRHSDSAAAADSGVGVGDGSSNGSSSSASRPGSGGSGGEGGGGGSGGNNSSRIGGGSGSSSRGGNGSRGSNRGGATTGSAATAASRVGSGSSASGAPSEREASPRAVVSPSTDDPACDVDVELQAACSIVQQHLESEGSVPMSQVTSALSVIQQDWFKVAGGKTTALREVEEYLSCFNDFSTELLARVVNMTDGNGNTVLHYAVSHCNFDIVRLIVDADVADVNKQNRAGYTPIMLAALADPTNDQDRAVLRRLLGKGDVNLAASRAGQTALMLAVSHGRVDMVRLLLDAGADVNAQDEDGSTALMCATEHGHTDIVRLLLGRPECDASIKDNDGSTALSIALETAQKEIGLLLYAREHGGKAAVPQTVKKRMIRPPATVSSGTSPSGASAASRASSSGTSTTSSVTVATSSGSSSSRLLTRKGK